MLERLGAIGEASGPLRLIERADPMLAPGEVRLRVETCGVCHTELDEIEGRAPPPRLPVVPGHQIVGRVDLVGDDVPADWIGCRVGVAWIASACGSCARCRDGRENLCPEFRATGRDVDGGYAEYAVARANFVHPIPSALDPVAAAPLLCAGAVGWRALKLSGLRNGEVLGLTGFGASGHLVMKVVRRQWPATPIYVFARSEAERRFALELGAAWAGDTWDEPPTAVDRIIDTTPAWGPVVAALRRLAPGGRLVINAIRKESADRARLGDLDYARDLWMEREIVSVANVTRADVREFLAVAAQLDVRPEAQTYPFEAANTALRELHERKIRGAKVLVIGAWARGLRCGEQCPHRCHVLRDLARRIVLRGERTGLDAGRCTCACPHPEPIGRSVPMAADARGPTPAARPGCHAPKDVPIPIDIPVAVRGWKPSGQTRARRRRPGCPALEFQREAARDRSRLPKGTGTPRNGGQAPDEKPQWIEGDMVES